MTLACEDANQKLVIAANVDAEKRVDNSLVQILKLKFGQYFAAVIWLRLWSWILVEIQKLGLVKIFELSFVEIFDILKLVLGPDSEDVWSKFV